MTTAQVSTGTTGAISELLAAAALMAEGFQVFRALSPACSCDLVVLVNGRLCRVEVRTGKHLADGRVTCGFNSLNDAARFDVLAVVMQESGRVVCLPTVEAWLAGERFDRFMVTRPTEASRRRAEARSKQAA